MHQKTPQSVKRSQKTTKMLRDIERELNSISNTKTLTPQMRRKVRELQKIHTNLKATYAEYVNMAVKKDVNSMFRHVLKKVQPRQRKTV
jgi:predicted translin family RNA/ssDNA-binding protein